MKKFLVVSCVCYALFLVSVLVAPLYLHKVTVLGSPETAVMMDPQDSSANVGETFTVNVTVVNVQNLFSVEATVTWNSSILKAVGIDVRLGQSDGVLNNPIYNPPVENSTQEGKYVLVDLSYNPAPSFNGTGNIVRITFSVINPGTCTLALESQLYDRPQPNDGSSQPIDHTTLSGSFNTPVTPEFPSFALLLIATVLISSAIVFSKKIRSKSLLRPANDRPY